MKKILFFSLIVSCLAGYLSCKKSQADQKPGSNESAVAGTAVPGQNLPRTASLTSSSCGNFLSGNHQGLNEYYTYPLYELDLSCVSTNGTISINVTSLDVPNLFEVVDQNLNIIATSHWLGNSCTPGNQYLNCYGGPWYNDPSFPNSGMMVLTFTKTAGPYSLRVRTITPPSTSYSPDIDTWLATILCSNCDSTPPPPPPGCPCPPGYTCVKNHCVQVQPPPACNCGGIFDGTYSVLNNYYTYPDKQLDICSAANGTTISVSLTANDVPNLFEIVDQNSNIIVSSGWLGTSCMSNNSCYYGPWPGGTLPQTNPGQKVISFTKDASKTYFLRVRTLTPPNAQFSPSTDFWGASLICGN
jgi:hypothetical protein